MVKRNYFTLFGLPVDFVLSLPQLEEAYLRLQKEFHPDRFATSVTVERELANQQTAEINLAYDTLKNPLTRARYLLELNNNYEVESERTIDDSAFLMEQMKWREEVEEAEGSVEALARLRQEVDDHLKQLYDEYALVYKKLPKEDKELVTLFHKMQYFTRLQQEIATKLS